MADKSRKMNAILKEDSKGGFDRRRSGAASREDSNGAGAKGSKEGKKRRRYCRYPRGLTKIQHVNINIYQVPGMCIIRLCIYLFIHYLRSVYIQRYFEVDHCIYGKDVSCQDTRSCWRCWC